MILTAWILACMFGFLSVVFLRKLLFASLNTKETVIFTMSIFISALSAGLIHTGSWQAFIS